MKLASSNRSRSYRRPAQQQRAAFFTTESSEHPAPLFASSQSESRHRAEPPFLQPRKDGVKAQEEEEAQAKAQEEEEEAAQPKAQEEEEEAAQPKAQEEEEEAAQPKAQEEEEEAAQPKAQEEEEEAAQPKAQEEEEEAAQPKAQEEEEEAAQPKAQEEEEEAAQPKAQEEEEEAAQPKAQEEEEKAAQPKAQEEEEMQTKSEVKAKKEGGAPCQDVAKSSRHKAMAESAVQSAKALTARAIAAVQTVRVSVDLPGPPPDALRGYERWFGEFDHERAFFVQSVFERIHHDLSAGNLTFRFNRGRREFAHIDPGGRGLTIWLGKLFWQKASNSGFNSRPGTLVHELSHTAAAVIDDFRYGTGPCKTLAIFKPSTAVRNADNYAYFVESL